MRLLTIASVGLAALALAACSTTPTKGPAGAGAGAAAGAGANGAATSGMNGSGSMSEAQLYAGKPTAANATVYFDFDSYLVKPQYRPMLQKNADFLEGNAKRHVAIEGHTDARGSREYNIALGERRAKAVRDVLLADGVSDDQIAVVSYGEERPAVEGTGEAVWAKNRRAVLDYGK